MTCRSRNPWPAMKNVTGEVLNVRIKAYLFRMTLTESKSNVIATIKIIYSQQIFISFKYKIS